MKNIAVILAGGSGMRFGDSTPKQFLRLAGKMVIEHTIDVFEQSERIDEICVVIREDFMREMQDIIERNNYRKVRKILKGGNERYESSLAAIEACTDDEDNLIFHDAVRPMVNERIINDCIDALEKYQAIDVAVRSTDTIIKVGGDDCIQSIPDRSELCNGQTPQCFKRGTIRRAYELALQDPGFKTTDDCGVVKKYMPQVPVYVVKGENFNMKLTYLEDLFLLDKLFQLRTAQTSQKELLVGNELKDKVVVVFGGSYGIGGAIVDLARQYGARVYSFSRSQNGVDVTESEAVVNALEEVSKKEGRIDAVVDTAGLLVKEPINEMSTDNVRRSIDVNLLGAINVARASFEYLRVSRGSLLFFTSSSYTRGRMMYSVYSATKAAIVNFTQAISEEWDDYGIRVNCINPKRTKTPMRINNFGEEPEGTLLDPRVVAVASINTLFSKATGEVIDVK
ncbi:MAG: 2-C-methyl-D-erythritol 4-phosphate cytidylyltransferase [Bacteroidales bacterium]|nr:2-C-methyl-D-erythritol 4-phosphate cytidylyltransferase [Bacteroidales bacterium]